MKKLAYRVKKALLYRENNIAYAAKAELDFRKILGSIRHQYQKIIFTTPYEFFIVDFYIPKYKLVIEIDGPSHIGNENYDAYRTKQLKSAGVRKVLRFTNEDIYTLPDETILQIVKIVV